MTGLHIIGSILGFILKTIAKIIVGMLWLALEFIKIFLMMLGFVFKVFMMFVDGVEI